ncbi:TAF11 [Candida oxycetoniae]|uniref:TAF11 n=1 Tax=Candida oxycetoniae TaxID=497107 RepID=A0AAI9STG4_9ASCO|nr:TAF11 [Candida oxycetoniae]KAI3402321.2 TAF11 [Candida oxycetoniae]
MNLSTLEKEDEKKEDFDRDDSMDEEDEELIWRVFFGEMERQGRLRDTTNNNERNSTASELADMIYQSSEDEEDKVSIASDILQGVDDPELIERFNKAKKMDIDKNLTEEEQKRLMITNLTDDQMERFEAYRRSTINKTGIKKLCNSIVGHSIPQVIATVMAGVTKSFVSEVISTALEVRERGHKAKLLNDIEEKKLQKSRFVRGASDIEGQVNFLSYDGDNPSPLTASHIREAYRLLKLQSSAASTFQRDH